jgi:hypothetical protein
MSMDACVKEYLGSKTDVDWDETLAGVMLLQSL